MKIIEFVSFTVDGHCELFPGLAVTNSTAVIIFILVFWIPLGYMLMNKISGS